MDRGPKQTMMARNERSQLETNWSRESTCPGDIVLLLQMELRSMLEVGVYRAAEVELLLPDPFLLVLGVDEVLGGAPQHDCLAYPFDGRPGSDRNLAAGASFAKCGAWRDHARTPGQL